jgi:hypothetical protein
MIYGMTDNKVFDKEAQKIVDNLDIDFDSIYWDAIKSNRMEEENETDND